MADVAGELRDPLGRWMKVGSTVHVAAEQSGYIGRGKVTAIEPDSGNLHVALSDGRKGRVRPDQAFKTKREALKFAQVPEERAGWSSVAKLNVVGRPDTKAARMMREAVRAPVRVAAGPAMAGSSAPAKGRRIAPVSSQGANRPGLSEAFADQKHPRDWHGRFRVGDVVRVGKGAGEKSVVGRIQRFTDDDSKAIVIPEHGGAHIEATPAQISFHDPMSAQRDLARRSALDPGKPHDETWAEMGSDREAIRQAKDRRAGRPSSPSEPAKPQAAPSKQSPPPAVNVGDQVHAPDHGIQGATVIERRKGMARLSGGSLGHYIGDARWIPVRNLQGVKVAQETPGAPGGPERRVERAMREAFAPSGAAGGETPAQSQQIAAKQIAQIQATKGSWQSSKHPRTTGGKFGQTTGGRRATRSQGSTRGAPGRYLTTGSSGSLVGSIQRQLRITTDGQYGPQTRQAVTAYQRQHGLKVDGIVGAQTLAALRGHVKPSSIKPGPIGSSTARIATHPTQRVRRASKTASKPKAPVRFGGGIVIGRP